MRAAVEEINNLVGAADDTLNARDFDRLWLRHRAGIWRLAARLSGNLDAADDLTQEVSLRAYQSFGQFRGESSEFTWLFRITVHVVLRWREKNGAHGVDLEFCHSRGPVGSSAESVAMESDLRAAVWNAMERLPNELRVTLVLRVYEGLSYREIAGILEVPIGTVMSRLNAARRRMREDLKEYEM